MSEHNNGVPHNAGQKITVQQISPMPVSDVDWGPVTIEENWGRLFISTQDSTIIVHQRAYKDFVAAINNFINPTE